MYRKKNKIKDIDKNTLFKNGYRYEYQYGEQSYTFMKKIFPIKIKRKNMYLNGIITICLTDGIYRMDVVTPDGSSYSPYYINDAAHRDFVNEIKKKMNYELKKITT